MKKIFFVACVLFAFVICIQDVNAANVQKVKPKAPVISEEMKPINIYI